MLTGPHQVSDSLLAAQTGTHPLIPTFTCISGISLQLPPHDLTPFVDKLAQGPPSPHSPDSTITIPHFTREMHQLFLFYHTFIGYYTPRQLHVRKHDHSPNHILLSYMNALDSIGDGNISMRDRNPRCTDSIHSITVWILEGTLVMQSCTSYLLEDAARPLMILCAIHRDCIIPFSSSVCIQPCPYGQ